MPKSANKEKSAFKEKILSTFFKIMEYSGLLLLVTGFTLQIIAKIPIGT
jgi:hypothetical protein